MSFPQLHDALKFALKAHKNTDRDGESPLPYFTHPVDVVNRLRYVGLVMNEEILVAAALHDVIEETRVKPSEIFDKFGATVLDLVLEVTREEPVVNGKVTEEEMWHLKSQLLLVEIDRMSDAAKTIKLADRASNLTMTLVIRKGEKLNRYLKQTQWILERIDRKTNPALWDSVSELLPKGS